MPTQWKKLENELGFSYYLDEISGLQQWDHPKFCEIKRNLDECNYVRHAKYRYALKIRVLQQALYMEEVCLETVNGIFEHHKLGTNEGTLCLDNCDLEAVLSDIFFATNKQNHKNIDVDYATELFLSLLYNIFDGERKGKIQVLSTKLLLVLLSPAPVTEMYEFLFRICSNHNNCVTRLRLQCLLLKIVDLSIFLHEDTTYGQHLINAVLDDCFKNSPGLIGVDQVSFLQWLDTGAQLLSWVPILKRLIASENVVHSAKCSTCKTSPFSGLKYRCTKCHRFTQCQICFLSGRIGNTHKLTHPMREYSTTDTKQTQNIWKKLQNIVWYYKNRENNNLVTSQKPINTPTACSVPRNQLENVIYELEQQNFKLDTYLRQQQNSDRVLHYLEEHRNQIARQIINLKTITENLNSGTSSIHNDVVEEVANGTEQKMDLDDALVKLQQILANNFTLEESLGNFDNNHLKKAVCEVEGMLTSIIDNVETSRAGSVLNY